MTRVIYCLNILLISAALIGCGADTVTDDGEIQGSTSNSADGAINAEASRTASTAELSASALRGKVLYESVEQGCLICHGQDGQSTVFKAIDLTAETFSHSDNPNLSHSLEEYIEIWMPVADPSDCKDDCAIDVANYIRVLSTTDAEESARNEDTASDSDTSSQANVLAQASMKDAEINCTNSSCHDSTPGSARLDLLSGSLEELARRMVNQPSGSNSCKDQLLIDPMNVEDSLLLKLIDKNATVGCNMTKMPLGSTGIPSAKLPIFKAWIDEIIAASAQLDQPDDSSNTQSETPVPGEALSVLNKIKRIMHGGAVSSEELNQASDTQGKIVPEVLQVLVDDWMQSPQYQSKLLQFLTMALQQDPADDDYRNQLGSISNAGDLNTALRNNLKEMMGRTAQRIISEGDNFQEVITTQDWEVTTGILAALRYADQTNRIRHPLRNAFVNSMTITGDSRHPYQDSDFNDWRTVRMQISSEVPQFTAIEDFRTLSFATALRNIADGDSFAVLTPRMGFLNTLAYLQKWETNVDNQFRVNINQAMITALGLIFESGDTTPTNHLEGLDSAHAVVGSDCFGCHQHLDPMRNAYTQYYKTGNQRAAGLNGSTNQPDFSFQGYSQSIRNMLDFGNALANHPNFAKAWTLKLCQWVSSTPCDSSDARVDSIAERFKQSNYNFNELMRAIMTSSLVTDSSFSQNSNIASSTVSITRQTNFCDGLTNRLGHIREKRNLPLNEATTDICNTNNARELAAGIPDDSMVRGVANFVQPTKLDPMLSTIYSRICIASAVTVVGTNDTKSFQSTNVSNSLDDMTEVMLGIPTSSTRYSSVRGTLQRLYDTARENNTCSSTEALTQSLDSEAECGLAMGRTKALRLVWTAVCQSPQLIGTGL